MQNKGKFLLRILSATSPIGILRLPAEEKYEEDKAQIQILANRFLLSRDVTDMHCSALQCSALSRFMTLPPAGFALQAETMQRRAGTEYFSAEDSVMACIQCLFHSLSSSLMHKNPAAKRIQNLSSKKIQFPLHISFLDSRS